MGTPLEQQHCEACEGDVKPMNQEQIKNLISQIPDWQVNEEGTEISRAFKFKNFFRTMSFVNAMAHIANQEGHHPDFKVGYNYCAIIFSTHSINGLSNNDFICARKVDRLL